MNRPRLNVSPTTRDVFCLVVVNVVVRTVWLMYFHPAQRADFQWYFIHATNLASGHGYTVNGLPTAYWPLGWPFFLSLVFRVTGPSVAVGMILNAILSTGIVLLVYASALRLWHARSIALMAAIAYTVLPSQIQWNSILGSEELFTCLALASLLVYQTKTPTRWVGIISSGVLMGLACDVRPVGLLFFVVVFAYERWITGSTVSTAAGRCVAYLLAMSVAVAPITVRNWVVFHHFILVSTNGGVNLWQGTKANGDYYWTWDSAVNPLLTGANEIARNAIGIHAAIATYVHYPWSMLGNALLKLWCLYRNDVNAAFYVYNADPFRPATVFLGRLDSLVYRIWMAISLWGIVCCCVRGHWRAGGLFLAFVLYNTLVFLFFPAWDRFRYPMMPVFALYAGVGLAYWRVLKDRVMRMFVLFRAV